MSPTDKIISFRSLAKQEEPPPPSEEMTELEHSIAYIASFLLDNKDNIKNVVCGVACKEQAEGDMAFHLLTTPIDVAEFALTLRLLENGFQRYLPDPD
jgi:hypothetical protein